MKIDLTKEQFRNLVKTNAIGNGILGVLGDTSNNTGYKEQSNVSEELEKHLLSYAKDFDCDDLMEDFEGDILLDNEFYEKKILPIINDYEEFSLYDGLVLELARRDFKQDHAETEIKRMAKKNGGYFGVKMYEYEEKYWNEFDKFQYERLYIKE